MLRIKYTYKDIDTYYKDMVDMAFHYYKKKDYERLFLAIELLAKIQYNFNCLYSDPGIENLLKIVSEELLELNKKEELLPKYVFYDSFGWENRGLTQQYLSALLSTNCEILFVFENYSAQFGKSICDKLEKEQKVTIFKLDNDLSKQEQLQQLYQRFVDFNPTAIFLHLTPWSIHPILLSYAFPNAVKYQLNLTDHAFWLGASCLDYVFEFRNFGITLSQEQRGISAKKQLFLPYYPILENLPFEGFPVNTEGKIIVFSGGSSYKIYSENGLFFRLIKILLDINPDVIFFFAGAGDFTLFESFIRENNYQQRVFLLGFRKDINEIFRRSDIYLSTYPFIGGLMSQYAASHSLPILAYTDQDRDVEGVVCINGYRDISFFNEKDFKCEATKLIKDNAYRKKIGNWNRKLVVSKEQFEEELWNLIQTKENRREFTHMEINYEKSCNWYLSVLNNRLIIEKIIIKHLGIKALKYPKLIINALVKSLLNKPTK